MPDTRQIVDVCIFWDFAPVPTSMRQSFARRTAFIAIPTPQKRAYGAQLQGLGWPFPIRTLLRQKLSKGERPGRILILGFSESCTGLGGLLKSADAGMIDTVLAVDGIHSAWVGGAPNKDHSNVDQAMLAPWYAMADLAASAELSSAQPIRGQRWMIDTHSAVRPPYVSTTETAAQILFHVYGQTDWPAANLPPGVVNVVEEPPFVNGPGQIEGGTQFPQRIYAQSPDLYQVGTEGLVVCGYSDLDPTGIGDHRYQSARVLPRMLQKLVIDRWNAHDPTTGVLGTVGQPDDDASGPGVVPPPEVYDGTQDLSLDWRKLLPPGTKGEPPKGGPGVINPETPHKYGPEPGPGLVSGGASVAFGLFIGWALGRIYIDLKRPIRAR